MKGFFPMSKWWAALVILIVAYMSYGLFGPIIETTLPTVAQDHVTASGWQSIQFTIANFWLGILIIFGGGLLMMIVAGIPGNKEDFPV